MNMYIHLRDRNVKQEKLCEIEDMSPEELGTENTKYDPRVLTQENLKRIQDAAMQRAGTAIMERQRMQNIEAKASNRQVAGDHYKRMDIQPWDVVDYGPREQAIGFYRYNALKYIMRAGEKGELKEDIAKAQHYLEKLLEII